MLASHLMKLNRTSLNRKAVSSTLLMIIRSLLINQEPFREYIATQEAEHFLTLTEQMVEKAALLKASC